MEAECRHAGIIEERDSVVSEQRLNRIDVQRLQELGLKQLTVPRDPVTGQREVIVGKQSMRGVIAGIDRKGFPALQQAPTVQIRDRDRLGQVSPRASRDPYQAGAATDTRCGYCSAQSSAEDRATLQQDGSVSACESSHRTMASDLRSSAFATQIPSRPSRSRCSST